MATFKLLLKEQRATDGLYLVYLRITQARLRAYVGTGIYVSQSQWHEKGKLENRDWVKKHPLKETYNSVLYSLLLKAQGLSLEHPTATAQKLKELLQGKQEQALDLIGFYALELTRLKQEANPRTHAKYEYIYTRLKAYAPVLPFDKLTVEWVKRYEQHVLTTNKRNTASKHLAFVKTIVRRAVAEGLLPYADNPFLNYKLKGEKPQKAKLTKDELQRIMDLKLPEGQRLHHARTAFLLQFFLAGMRIGDLLQLRWEMLDGDRLEYRSQKTGTLLSVRLVPAALALIQPFQQEQGYILPFLKEGLTPEKHQNRIESMTALINRMLREIATRAQIDKKITTHIARHSFASLAWANSRDIKAVSQALGHTSVRMTETYLRELTGAEQDSLLDTTFEGF